ncbi:hypothetical protein [Archangium violaceum]|uniref:Uncharacterized protein n=1 Tax=Archangium violaceum Cb vi76 TaxID=1406225 RepID=A0A084SR00_9BACT|nr:hypothetical protein [Archangium violaceum]KFA90885.1 hypothetical protein Q664_25830 [Archangium violaceum Cb vi76]
MEVILVSLVGMLLFGGLFLLLCPEWWSNSLGMIKEKKRVGREPAEKALEAGDASRPKTDT